MSSQFLSSLVLYASLACLILCLLIERKRSSHGAKRLPPGPPRLPLIGNFHQLKTPLHITLHRLSKIYGDLMFLQLGSVSAIVISSAEIVKEICKFHDITFSDRPILHVPWKMKYKGHGMVFVSYGEYWREVRKIAILELFSVKMVQSFQAIRAEEVTQLLDSIENSSGPVNLSELVHVLTNNVICLAAFGKKFYGGRNHMGRRTPKQMLQELQSLLGTIYLSDFFPWMGWVDKLRGLDERLEKNFKEFDELYEEIIEEHRDPERPRPDREDLVDVLIRLQKDSDLPVAVGNEFIKALIADMFASGTDTSSSVLIWAMTELIRNPSVMKQVQEEVRRVREGKQKIEEIHLEKLVYLKMVVKETLRLHAAPPLLLPRETNKACKIRGYEIPAKTRVFINAKAISIDHRMWNDPLEFRPERFLDSPIDFRGQDFELIPFGFGRRICPGINFAIVTIELVLANLLFRFNWKLPHEINIGNVNMDETLGITVHKKAPLCLTATPNL